jgi:hypothetical protein
MSIKTNELQQLSSILGTDSLLADTAAAGTGRLSLARAAEFFGAELVKPTNPVGAALSNKVSKTTRSDIYVAKAGSDETGDGSETAPYLTIQRAINSIGHILEFRITLHIGAGTYDEDIVFNNIQGGGVHVKCAQNENGASAVQVKSMTIYQCNTHISVFDMEIYGRNRDNSTIYISNFCIVSLQNVVCKTDNREHNTPALWINSSSAVFIRSCTISNQFCAVYAVGSIVYLNSGTTGSNNTVSLWSGNGNGSIGAIILKGSSTIAGATETREYGGQIF